MLTRTRKTSDTKETDKKSGSLSYHTMVYQNIIFCVIH